MAKQAIVLFGAGASMDAGLPGAFGLTNKVYEKLVQEKSDDARLFGIIIAKLQLRAARLGHPPFSSINIEEVYDALKKFIGREQDILAEFVQNWEDITGPSECDFNAQKFLQSLSSAFEVSNSRSLTGQYSLRVKHSELVRATEVLSKAFYGDFYKFRGASLDPFLHTLSLLLEADDNRIGYMQRMLERHASRISCIATLNYDRIVERSLETRGASFDLGLSSWNERRYVRFHGQSQKLIKLHGSIDWFIKDQDEIMVNPQGPSVAYPRRALIFGGQDSKLVPFGPFLQLRHEFQKFLRASNKLLVVGYSFGDEHLNAILRSWVATRQRSRMMVVNPSGFEKIDQIMRFSRVKSRAGHERELVKLEVVEKGFLDAQPEVEAFLTS